MCSPPDIQLIFAELSLTAELTFDRAGTDGEKMKQEEGKGEKSQTRVSKGQSR